MAKHDVRRRFWLQRGIPVVALVVIVGGVFGTRAFASGGDDSSYRFGTVVKGSVAQTLTLNGTVEQASKSTTAFAVSGTVKTVPVAIGDTVTAGQTLATVDTTTLEAALTSAKATLAAAKASLESAESGSSSSSGSTAATETSASTGSTGSTVSTSTVTAVDVAYVTKTSTKVTSTPSSAAAAVKKAQGAVTSAQTAATKALAALDAAEKAQTTTCSAIGTSSSTAEITACVSAVQDTIAAQAKAATAQSTLQSAENSLATALATQARVAASTTTGSSSASGSTAGAGSATKSSGGSSGVAKSSNGSSAGSGGSGSASNGSTGGSSGSGGSSSQQIASDKAAVTTATTALTTAKKDLADATLTAPISGTVAALSYVAGSASGSDSVTIVGTGAADVTVDVPLTSLPAVKVGQAATVTAAGSATALTGTVRSISLLPVSSTSTTASYPVVIRVAKPSAALASGSTATAVVTLRMVSNVLTVPSSAVSTLTTGTGVVRTVKGSTVTRTVVKLGAVGATTIQVTSGLTLGERVVIADLSQALPTTTTTNNRFGSTGSGLASSLTGSGAGPVGGGGPP